MSYTELFVAPIPVDAKPKYVAMCQTMQEVMLEFGALSCADFWAEDVPDGKITSLPMAVKLEKDEVVAMGWVKWPDKATRDAGWAKMMDDQGEMEMPFDGKRLIFGGFSEIAQSSAKTSA